MHKLPFIFVALALSAASRLTAPPLFAAQAGPSAPAHGGPEVGALVFDARTTHYRPGLLHLAGRVRVTSENYDLAGEDVKLFLTRSAAGSKSTLKKAFVEGNLAAGQQVVVHVRQPLQGQNYEIFADHAVYTPETSRPGGGRMDFTGHVKVITDSGFLTGPSVTTTDHATILMGQGEDYPQVDTGPTHITATPAQQ